MIPGVSVSVPQSGGFQSLLGNTCLIFQHSAHQPLPDLLPSLEVNLSFPFLFLVAAVAAPQPPAHTTNGVLGTPYTEQVKFLDCSSDSP